MRKGQQEQKQFLEEQVEWCKKQDRILEEIEIKLYAMRKLAEYARDNEFTSFELDELNVQLNNLKSEIEVLEKQLQTLVH